MESDTTLILGLDERNLAHYLSALALAAFAQRIEGHAHESRRCWWPASGPGHFAIQTEHPRDEFRTLLFDKAHDFLKAMQWHPGLNGASSGLLTSGSEMGVNPFVALSGDAGENTPLKVFSGNESPGQRLEQQQKLLIAASSSTDWLVELARGKCRWGYDCRVKMHASDTGYSPDAENTGDSNPLYPAIELLSLAAAAFFAPAHAWQTSKNTLRGLAWSNVLPLSMVTHAATGRIHGLCGRQYGFTYRPAGHGDAGKYKFFPPATLQPTTP